MSLSNTTLNVSTVECTKLQINGVNFSNNYITQARQAMATHIMNQITNASSSTIQAVKDSNSERVKISYKTITNVNVNSAPNYVKIDNNNKLYITNPSTSSWNWQNNFGAGNNFPIRLGHAGLKKHGSEYWWTSRQLRFDIGGGTGRSYSKAGGQAYLFVKRKNGDRYNNQYFWVHGTTQNNDNAFSHKEVNWETWSDSWDFGLLGIPEDDIPVNIVSSFGTTTESDKRLKENILPIKNAMKSIKKVNIVQYQIRHKYNYPPCIGVIAQELEEIKDPLLMRTVDIPENIEENPYKVSEYPLFSTNIKALQEFNQDFIKEKKETIEMLNILDEKINILENKLS
jgi:hypothetical protein